MVACTADKARWHVIRALLLATMLASALVLYSCGDTRPVFAQTSFAQGWGGSQPPPGPNAIHPSKELSDWFVSLKRPLGKRQEDWLPMVTSCCSLGDAYPIEIEQEATIDGEAMDGTAHVTDTKAKEFVLFNGRSILVWAIKGDPRFKFSGLHVVKEKYGNPTTTAWAFLNVTSDGIITHVYCVVPLPPGF